MEYFHQINPFSPVQNTLAFQQPNPDLIYQDKVPKVAQ